jgi:RHS repeat-associated protein
LPTSTSFNANAALSTGNNAATVNIIDGNNNSVTNTYQINVKGGPSASLSFDSNGNCTTDQNGNTISYDAENRMIKIQYPGTGNYSTFVYDGLGYNVSIVETRSGSVTSTQQFVWCDNDRCEARNSGGSVTAQFFQLGENIGGAPYSFTLDKLGSIREVTNSSGTVVCVLNYDPFGRPVQIQGSMVPDFQFAGYYFHAPSGLCVTRTRAYSASLGRFINRDPIEEQGGVNLFSYVGNQPVRRTDSTGLMPLDLGGGEAGISPNGIGAPNTLLPITTPGLVLPNFGVTPEINTPFGTIPSIPLIFNVLPPVLTPFTPKCVKPPLNPGGDPHNQNYPNYQSPDPNFRPFDPTNIEDPPGLRNPFKYDSPYGPYLVPTATA